MTLIHDNIAFYIITIFAKYVTDNNDVSTFACTMPANIYYVNYYITYKTIVI